MAATERLLSRLRLHAGSGNRRLSVPGHGSERGREAGASFTWQSLNTASVPVLDNSFQIGPAGTNGTDKMTRDLSGIYAIANDHLMTSEHFLAAVEGALAGGVRLLQYRNKAATQPADRRVAIGYELLKLCQQYQVPLLINDDLEFCAEIGAQGALGQRDGDCRSARAKLGPDAIIGITRHDSLTLAQTAAADGADYVAFGRFSPQSPNRRRRRRR